MFFLEGFPSGLGNTMNEERDTVVSKDGILYTNDKEVITLLVPDRPLWRFREPIGSKQGLAEGLIPVWKTF